MALGLRREALPTVEVKSATRSCSPAGLYPKAGWPAAYISRQSPHDRSGGQWHFSASNLHIV